jgi:precorrin-2/cobalt-factor-2 C20-methyltransferase
MLIGVGLGPGNPNLLTLEAVNVLKSATKVFVPGRVSYELAKPYSDPEILTFPMTRDKRELSKAWDDNVKIISKHAAVETTAFGVLGDPNVFSTFSHVAAIIKKTRPQIPVETVPGVSSITACLSRLDASVSESFVVSDRSAVRSTVVLKATNPREIAASLEREGFSDFKLLEAGFTGRERCYERDFPARSEYFSIMFARRV